MDVAKKQAAAKIAPKAVAKGHPVFASTQQAAQAAPQRQAVHAAATRSIGIQADGGHDVAVQCEVVHFHPRNGPGNVSLWILPARRAWAAPPLRWRPIELLAPEQRQMLPTTRQLLQQRQLTQVQALEPPALQRSRNFSQMCEGKLLPQMIFSESS